MEPVWMNSFHCLYDRSFEQYVDELPTPEQLTQDLNQRNYMFCWLHHPVLEEIMITPGETALVELVGASYTQENGYPVQNARYYRYTHTGEDDFLMVTEDGEITDNLTFESMIEAGSNLHKIQRDL
jgi:hypothetical protein